MSTKIYDITVPAQIGMRSYEHENRGLRSSLLLNAGAYTESAPQTRVILTEQGARASNACITYRFVAEAESFERIAQAANDAFPDGTLEIVVHVIPKVA